MYNMFYYEHGVLFYGNASRAAGQQTKTPSSSDSGQAAGIRSEMETGMSRKNVPDRRVQRTRRMLLDALLELILEKGYEAVTVQDVIDRADVGRSTFYAHFQDKEHLLLSGSEKMQTAFEEFRSHSSRGKPRWDFSLALFRHAEEQRRVFKAMLGKQVGDVVVGRIRESLTLYLTEHFQAFGTRKKGTVPLNVVVPYCVSAFLGLLTWWLDNDITFTADQMNGYFQALIAPTLHTLGGGSLSL